MRINYNISSIIAKNALNNNDLRLTASTQRLSSGYKINSAKDDAAGLAIARKMNIQLRALERANQNSNDGLSVVDTADGAMSEVHSILQRLNELSVQAANGTNSDSDRGQIQLEVDQLVDEIDRIAETTQFNAQNLLDGSFAYKGYTNLENAKVMSYSDDVSKGIYKINSLAYFKYGDETVTYTDGTTADEYNTDEDYEVYNSNDAIKKALVTSSTNSSINTFPKDAKVSVSDEYITISDDDGFEMKLAVNDKKTDEHTNKTDGSVTVKTYNNVKLTDAAGNEYNISSLIDINVTNDVGIIKDKDGNTVNDISDSIYSEEKTKMYTSLAEDLGIENISNVDISDAGDEVTVTYKDDAGNDATLTLNTVTNDDGTQKTLDDYLYSTSTREISQYSIGQHCQLSIDVTKMGPMVVQTGANEGQQLEIEIPAIYAKNLGLEGLSVSTEDDATEAIDKVSKAINQLSSYRSKIGAYANRLETTITSLDTTEENLTQAYSRIMDTDMAEEMTEYSTVQVLVQAATSVLSQANERPQQVLQLLQ